MTEPLDAVTVSTVAQAIYSSAGSGRHSWPTWDEVGEQSNEYWRGQAEAAVRAVLATQRPCLECGGDGGHECGYKKCTGPHEIPCTVCEGRGTLGPAYIATERLEQVGWKRPSTAVLIPNEDGPLNNSEPVYRIQGETL